MIIISDSEIKFESNKEKKYVLDKGLFKQYKQSDYDPMVFEIDWPECQLRKVQLIRLDCGKRVHLPQCTNDCTTVTPRICTECLNGKTIKTKTLENIG